MGSWIGGREVGRFFWTPRLRSDSYAEGLPIKTMNTDERGGGPGFLMIGIVGSGVSGGFLRRAVG